MTPQKKFAALSFAAALGAVVAGPVRLVESRPTLRTMADVARRPRRVATVRAAAAQYERDLWNADVDAKNARRRAARQGGRA